MNRRDTYSCPHEACIAVAGPDDVPAHLEGRVAVTPVRKGKVWEQHRELGLYWMGCQEKPVLVGNRMRDLPPEDGNFCP